MLKSIEHVKVNLSPAELMNEHLSNELLSIMKRYGLSPSIFQFEITETIATMYKPEPLLGNRRTQTGGLWTLSGRLRFWIRKFGRCNEASVRRGQDRQFDVIRNR